MTISIQRTKYEGLNNALCFHQNLKLSRNSERNKYIHKKEVFIFLGILGGVRMSKIYFNDLAFIS